MRRGFPQGYARPLGEALNGNEHVESLSLDIRGLLLQPSSESNNDDIEEQVLPLLNYIRTGSAVRILGLNTIWATIAPHVLQLLMSLFLQAAAASQNLTELNVISSTPLPMQDLCNLLDQSTSLRSLRLPVNSACFPDDDESLGQALGRNTILESLVCSRCDAGMLDSLLLQLTLGAAPWQELVLVVGYGIGRVMHPGHVATLLHNPAAGLCSLVLGRFSFDESLAESFVRALSSNQTLEKLCLAGCSFDVAATGQFVDFWKRHPDSWVGSMLQELSWSHDLVTSNVGDDREFDSEISPGVVAAQLLTTRPASLEDDGPAFLNERMTIGSSLQKLKLPVTFITDFFPEYASNAANIRLPHLVLSGGVSRDSPAGAGTWRCIAMHLPCILYLSTLTFNWILESAALVSDHFVPALRGNGSVSSLGPGDHLLRRLLSKKNYRLVQACLARNRLVPALLKHPKRSDGNDIAPSRHETDMSHPCISANRSACASTTTTTTPPPMFPALFQCMEPVVRMSPNTVLSGLLALGGGN